MKLQASCRKLFNIEHDWPTKNSYKFINFSFSLVQRTLQLQGTTPMLAAVCHNAAGTAMPPTVLTDCL